MLETRLVGVPRGRRPPVAQTPALPSRVSARGVVRLGPLPIRYPEPGGRPSPGRLI